MVSMMPLKKAIKIMTLAPKKAQAGNPLSPDNLSTAIARITAAKPEELSAEQQQAIAPGLALYQKGDLAEAVQAALDKHPGIKTEVESQLAALKVEKRTPPPAKNEGMDEADFSDVKPEEEEERIFEVEELSGVEVEDPAEEDLGPTAEVAMPELNLPPEPGEELAGPPAPAELEADEQVLPTTSLIQMPSIPSPLYAAPVEEGSPLPAFQANGEAYGKLMVKLRNPRASDSAVVRTALEAFPEVEEGDKQSPLVGEMTAMTAMPAGLIAASGDQNLPEAAPEPRQQLQVAINQIQQAAKGLPQDEATETTKNALRTVVRAENLTGIDIEALAATLAELRLKQPDCEVLIDGIMEAFPGLEAPFTTALEGLAEAAAARRSTPHIGRETPEEIVLKKGLPQEPQQRSAQEPENPLAELKRGLRETPKKPTMPKQYSEHQRLLTRLSSLSFDIGEVQKDLEELEARLAGERQDYERLSADFAAAHRTVASLEQNIVALTRNLRKAEQATETQRAEAVNAVLGKYGPKIEKLEAEHHDLEMAEKQKLTRLETEQQGKLAEGTAKINEEIDGKIAKAQSELSNFEETVKTELKNTLRETAAGLKQGLADIAEIYRQPGLLASDKEREISDAHARAKQARQEARQKAQATIRDRSSEVKDEIAQLEQTRTEQIEALKAQTDTAIAKLRSTAEKNIAESQQTTRQAIAELEVRQEEELAQVQVPASEDRDTQIAQRRLEASKKALPVRMTEKQRAEQAAIAAAQAVVDTSAEIDKEQGKLKSLATSLGKVAKEYDEWDAQHGRGRLDEAFALLGLDRTKPKGFKKGPTF